MNVTLKQYAIQVSVSHLNAVKELSISKLYFPSSDQTQKNHRLDWLLFRERLDWAPLTRPHI
jgi:hypothetical protein